MQDYMEGWLVAWLLICLIGLAAVLTAEGLPRDWGGRLLFMPTISALGAYLAVPLAPAGALLLAALR
jgi:hypothetical protein